MITSADLRLEIEVDIALHLDSQPAAGTLPQLATTIMQTIGAQVSAEADRAETQWGATSDPLMQEYHHGRRDALREVARLLIADGKVTP